MTRTLLAALPLAALLLAAPLAAPARADDTAVLNACIEEAIGHAEEPQSCIGAVSGPCGEALPSDANYPDYARCETREAEAWDALLNADWKLLLEELDEEDIELVREAQRAWIAFRDADCLAVTMMAHPVRGGLWGAGCERDRTAIRALQIREMLGDRGQ